MTECASQLVLHGSLPDIPDITRLYESDDGGALPFIYVLNFGRFQA
ncbi:hypothetical protein AG1IA_04125 [Rhizoctonia solani AG-1 IA]|uniref:Uncharacterized protein n=1 Tax=Thanatephorus cucumeris (strain AG1-IA) TaxID=983506 RepID=L8WZR9_THACA|nr:hypothetical protein AG1IA_04125 [Rhizoctonia solani AG-1 IA]